MTKQTVWVHLLTQMEHDMLDSGQMISNMEMERRVGIMVKLNTLVSSSKERNMAKEDFYGKMVAIMMVILLMANLKDMVNTISQT